MATIIVQEELDAQDLDNRLWSEAIRTWENIRKAGKEQAAIAFLNEVFCDRVPTITEVNDLLWFDDALIYEAVGLNENGEEVEEDKDEEEGL